MESIPMNEPRSRSLSSVAPKSHRSKPRSSQLPTPETSWSGYETQDSDSQEESTSRTAPRRDSRIQSSRPSPPYQTSDVQRPLLPPLKTILGDNIRSPPRTPSMHDIPSPREPTYTASTYKPSSLYPYKKQRTGLVLEPVPPIDSSTSFRSSLLPSPTFDPNMTAMSMNRDGVFQVQELQPGLTVVRRTSSLYREKLPPSHTASESYQHPQQSYIVDNAPKNGFHPVLRGRHETPESMSTHRSTERDYQRSQPINDAFIGRVSRDASITMPERPAPHRSLINEQGQPNVGKERRKHDSPRPQETDPRFEQIGFNGHERILQLGLGEQYFSHPPCTFGCPYQNNQHAFFMPSHFDYQHGKTRKRSNLPKQSTEVMETWFDQNITNPYPSEEQKAAFSHNTGISMNQVSNWFINHRRRCPELRDKREKTRGREFEVD